MLKIDEWRDGDECQQRDEGIKITLDRLDEAGERRRVGRKTDDDEEEKRGREDERILVDVGDVRPGKSGNRRRDVFEKAARRSRDFGFFFSFLPRAGETCGKRKGNGGVVGDE